MVKRCLAERRIMSRFSRRSKEPYPGLLSLTPSEALYDTSWIMTCQRYWQPEGKCICGYHPGITVSERTKEEIKRDAEYQKRILDMLQTRQNEGWVKLDDNTLYTIGYRKNLLSRLFGLRDESDRIALLWHHNYLFGPNSPEYIDPNDIKKYAENPELLRLERRWD